VVPLELQKLRAEILNGQFKQDLSKQKTSMAAAYKEEYYGSVFVPGVNATTDVEETVAVVKRR
jgi:hypothetical protein